MIDSDEESVPRILLTVPTEYQSTIPKSSSTENKVTMATKSQPLFDDTNNEIKFRQRVIEAVPFYNGDPADLSDWLHQTGTFFARECIPDAHQIFAIRFLLTDQALDVYNAHEDLIRNFNDLRKLLQSAAGKTPMRTLASLDTIPSFTINMPPPAANSTRSDPTTSTSFTNTSITFTQSPDDLTQNEYRKSIIAQFHDDKSLKFSGEHKQDVLKWIEKLERKFELAEISDAKRFDYLTELLQKGALNWFLDHKTSLNRSWLEFVQQFKKVYDSPNRSQLAFQKLQYYHQSADQDIRSFCCVIRKLCKEYDPEMSKKMRVDFLLRSVNPIYRPDILKLKPTDADEFETAAIQVENTFLTLTAYEANTSVAAPAYPSLLSQDYRYPSQHSLPATNYNYQRSQPPSRSNPRSYSNTASRGVHYSQNTSQSSQQPSPYPSLMPPRQPNLFAYTTPTPGPQSSQQQQQPQQQQKQHQSEQVIHPPKTSSQPKHASPLLHTQPVICQGCNQLGHSARDCPF